MQVSTSISAGTRSQGDTKRAVFPVGHMVLFSLVTVLFFLWGMSNNLTDILVQQFRKSFELSPPSAQLVPAAVSGQYLPFLVALFTVGSGASFLETAANPFIAQFGDPATSEQRLNFSQSFNPPGTIVGVLIGSQFIFSGVEKTAPEIAQMRAAGTYHAYLHM